ncbi:MAG: hypothetical protein IPM54_25655 [Polyangiaceae bacterium]|nr:hypothetical protein [Polyangiaceae bacterium]
MRFSFFWFALLVISIAPACNCDPDVQSGTPCNAVADCPAPTGTCREWRCVEGLCIDFAASAGTLCNAGAGVCNWDAECAACGDEEVQDAQETDVDCGGPICKARCDVGKKCSIASDCITNKCKAGICDKPSCTDNVHDPINEADVDCGGACASKCKPGKMCKVDTDCAPAGSSGKGACRFGICCAVPCDEPCRTCVVGTGACALVPDGPDPGGRCANAGDTCNAEGKCSDCVNGIKDNLETDSDCGGGICPPCKAANAGACSTDADCDSCTCSGGTCTAPKCNDGLRNGCETDVDCGGPCGATCGIGMNCNVKGDCLSNDCEEQQCTQP